MSRLRIRTPDDELKPDGPDREGGRGGETAAPAPESQSLGSRAAPARGLEPEVERLRAEEIERLRAELRSALEFKTDFLSVVNHELRTPLSALLGYLFLAERKLGSPGDKSRLSDVATMLGKARAAGGRLVRLLDELAAMEWIHRDDLPLVLTQVSVPRLIDQVLGEIRLLAADRKLRLKNEMPRQPPGPIVADAEKLTQLFEHLIGNAVKYTPDGGEVRIHCEAADGGGLHVTIRDGGVGVPAGDLERIFEPFYHGAPVRYHSTGKTKFMGAGLGLGLPVSRGIAKAHGGRLWAESRGFDPRHLPGTTLHLVLPKHPPCADAVERGGSGHEPFVEQRPTSRSAVMGEPNRANPPQAEVSAPEESRIRTESSGGQHGSR